MLTVELLFGISELRRGTGMRVEKGEASLLCLCLYLLIRSNFRLVLLAGDPQS
jgi:hypothetical protein